MDMSVNPWLHRIRQIAVSRSLKSRIALDVVVERDVELVGGERV